MLSRAQYEIVAGPFDILEVDFYRHNATSFDAQGDEGLVVKTRGPAVTAGELHAVISWFDVELDREGQIVLSSAPWADDNSFSRQQHCTFS